MSPVGLGKQSANARRTFVGVIEMDGRENSIKGTGNGPISSLADAPKNIKDYKEHAIGSGQDTKAATFIECVAGGKTVWGVGIHEDAAQASLIGLSMVNSVPQLP